MYKWITICPGAWKREDTLTMVVDKSEPAPFQKCRYSICYGKKQVGLLISTGCDTAKVMVDKMFPLRKCRGCIWHGLMYDCPHERIDIETDEQSGPPDDCPACDNYTTPEEYCKWIDGRENDADLD